MVVCVCVCVCCGELVRGTESKGAVKEAPTGLEKMKKKKIEGEKYPHKI